jgi:tetratricopeptide (TPR) repeat protein
MRHLPLLLALALPAGAAAQGVQYRSPAGVEYGAAGDTAAIVKAEQALAADPRNVDRIIELGVAQSGARRFREAIRTFTRGLELAPDDARLYRWRGHRYLSVRETDRALADLERAARLDSTLYGAWYHIGVARYLRGEFGLAAAAFERALRNPPNPDELAGSVDWLWSSLARGGRAAEAAALLARRPDSLPSQAAYVRRLALYRGTMVPDQVMTPADTADVQVATLSYGIGNWHLVRGDTASAVRWFERAIASGGWPAFGFMAAEMELRRLRR